MKVHEKLLKVQTELKAPKNLHNNFGNFNYRSCEDILEALKPLLLEYKLSLIITDEIVLIGDRYYIKATATVTDIETGDKEYSVAYAREEENKKGMDGSQVTGSTSSYARKYALNGLFCIDDTKDSDDPSVSKEQDKPKSKAKPKPKPKQQGQGQTQEIMQCEDCGAPVGVAVINYSKKQYGKVLCMDCQKK